MLIDWAIKYAEHGFSVIPINKDKRPLIKFADKPPLTVEQIKQIWAKYPNTNIALKTDKFFVIDVDRHTVGVDGLNSIKGTLTEKTANNGYHFFFLKPNNITLSQNIGFLPSVDLKEHPNNYVVVSPSVLNGNPYRWLNHFPIKAAPKGLIQLILSKQQAKGTFYTTDHTNSSNKTKTAQLFEMIANGLGDVGNRNDTLTSFIGSLLFRGVNPYSVAELAHIANEHTPDPLPEKEVIKTVNSVAKKENRRCLR
jgi:hypothetical protein